MSGVWESQTQDFPKHTPRSGQPLLVQLEFEVYLFCLSFGYIIGIQLGELGESYLIQ